MEKSLEIDELWSKRISQSLHGLEYGAVQIIVHDGRIVQIERTERNRFDQAARIQQPDVTQTKPVKATGKSFL
ncbi:MAG: YezD family protein [Paenibacillaceae bacterium]